MRGTSTPMQRLVELSGQKASGEFICAAPSMEVHVFLQGGQIAWATDSRHPFAFARQLRAEGSVDEGTFRQVVEECRRERLPLGRTLVEWGLVSTDGVRAALRAQIAMAITELREVGAAQVLFLERAWQQQRDDFTFSLQDFDGHEPHAEPKGNALISTVDGRLNLAQQLRAAIEGVSWVEVFEGQRLCESDPEVVESPRTPSLVLESSIGSGADFVAVRTSSGSLAGLALGRSERSVCCGLRTESTFGSSVSLLWTLASADHPPPSRQTTLRQGNRCFVGEPALAEAQEIAGFMTRAREVLAAVLLDGSESPTPVVGYCDQSLDETQWLDIARRRLPCFRVGLNVDSPSSSLRMGSSGFYLKTMVTGEGSTWCFGAELLPEAQQTLWLFLSRSSSQGMGWACLAALTRVLARLPRREAQ